MAENPDSPPYEKGKLYNISLDKIHSNPKQPRQTTDEVALAELTASIAKLGIIEPVVLKVEEQDTLVVVAGERRVMAARNAGRTTIPALFIDGNYAEIALIENLQRQDLTPIEEAEGLQALKVEHNYTQEELAAIIGKAQNTLSEILSLTKLPQEVRDDCRGDRRISKNILIEIAKKKQPRGMITAYNNYKAKIQKGTAPRPKRDANEPQSILDLLEKAVSKIQAMDTTAWTEENKNYLHATLTSLKTEIDNYLQRLVPTPPA